LLSRRWRAVWPRSGTRNGGCRLPGALNCFVNDQQGRPLLFVTEEADARLRNAMPRIVGAIREVLGERSFTVIFDRGGYDRKLFNWLREEKIDFITYQQANPKLAVERFCPHECRFEAAACTCGWSRTPSKSVSQGPGGGS